MGSSDTALSAFNTSMLTIAFPTSLTSDVNNVVRADEHFRSVVVDAQSNCYPRQATLDAVHEARDTWAAEVEILLKDMGNYQQFLKEYNSS